MDRSATLRCSATTALCLFFLTTGSMGTVFTYQGNLQNTGNSVTGTIDFQFSLWSAENGGSQISTVLTIEDVDVADGFFTVKLDFGSANSFLFSGAERWLEITVRPGASVGSFTTLSPRQEITYVPYAIHALNGTGGSWTVSGPDIYFDAGDVGVGTTSPTAPLHIETDLSDQWLHLDKSGATKWNFDYFSNAGLGLDSALRVETDGSPLDLYLSDDPGGMRMYLWETGRAVPNMPHTGVKPTFALWGDMLIGDIICIERNPMTLFMREQTGLPSSSATVFFCARAINNDTDGGAGILLHPDDGVSSDSGSLQLIAYGQGGSFANTIRLQTRTGPGTPGDVMVVQNGHVQVTGTIGATGGWVSSRTLKKNIHPLDVDQALNLVKQLDTVIYQYKLDPDENDRVGFISEDVPDVFAGADRKGVDYMGVAAMLAKVVQEQQKQIDTMQRKLLELEARVESGSPLK